MKNKKIEEEVKRRIAEEVECQRESFYWKCKEQRERAVKMINGECIGEDISKAFLANPFATIIEILTALYAKELAKPAPDTEIIIKIVTAISSVKKDERGKEVALPGYQLCVDLDKC